MTVVEECPPEIAHEDAPEYGGSLFFHQDTGVAGCPACGWTGLPTLVGGVVPTIRHERGGERRTVPATIKPGVASTRCPACQHEPDRLRQCDNDRRLRMRTVPRNQPCPCGSGAKAKKCACPGFTV